MSPNPLFLLSLPRSGSTLAQRVLAAHPKISTAPEPWILLPQVYALRERGAQAEYTHVVAARAIHDLAERLPGGEQDYWDQVREFALGIYEKAARVQSDGDRGEGGVGAYFLDKTPRYHFILPELFRIFPDAKYVFLWRSPLSVVASMVETWGRGKWNVDRWHGDVYDGIDHLVTTYEEHRTQICSIRFEDLVGDPMGTWPGVFEYLGLEFDPAVLESFSDVRIEARMGDPTGIKRYRSLSSEPIDKWTATMHTPMRRQWCRNYLGWIGPDRLRHMGYDMDELIAAIDSAPSRPSRLLSDAMHAGYWKLARLRKEAAYRRMAPRLK